MDTGFGASEAKAQDLPLDAEMEEPIPSITDPKMEALLMRT